jgi:hypothetical protein
MHQYFGLNQSTVGVTGHSIWHSCCKIGYRLGLLAQKRQLLQNVKVYNTLFKNKTHTNPLIYLHSLDQYSQILTHPFLAMSYTFQRLYALWPIADLEKLYKSHRSTVESSARTFPARSLLTALV